MRQLISNAGEPIDFARFRGMRTQVVALLVLISSALAFAQADAPLTPSEATAAQGLGVDPSQVTPTQLEKARSMLGGRDPLSLSPSELEAAKSAADAYMSKQSQQSQQQGADAQSQDQNGSKSKTQVKSPGTHVGDNEQDNAATDETTTEFDDWRKKRTQNDSLKEFKRETIGNLQRYEMEIFSRAMPSAFFNVQTAVAPDYPIKPGDALTLTLWGSVEKEYPLTVNTQGKVNVEGVGLVSLNNLNLGKAEQILRNKLKEVYAGIGQGKIFVNLRPESLASTKIFVMGEVQRPGGFDLPGNSNVFLALYRAMGPSQIGSVRRIQITHANGEKNEIDLYDYLLKGQKAEQSILKDGDVVFLPRAEKLVAVKGDVGRPAIFELKGKEGIREALAFAASINPTAAHKLSLLRVMDDGRKDVMDLESPKDYVQGDKAFSLLDGDELDVKASTKTGHDYVEVIGAVWYPGQYKWQPGMKVDQAVEVAGGTRGDALSERIVVRRPLPNGEFTYLADSLKATGQRLEIQPLDQIIVLSLTLTKVVHPVRVAGAVKKPQTMSWTESMTVKTVIALCDGFTNSHLKGIVRIERLIPGKFEVNVITVPIRDDLSLEGDGDMKLEPGDRVVVPFDPNYYEQELVSLSGAFTNAGKYSLIRQRESFKAFMDRVGSLEKNAFPQGGRLYRKRGKESFLVNFDMEQALKGKEGAEISLQGGDSIWIPQEQLTVQVKGEVVSKGDVIWKKGMSIKDYIDASGGFSINGDADRVVVAYADGTRATMSRADRDPDPGSVIFVPWKKEDEPVDWFKVWSSIATILGAVASVTMAWAVITKK